MMRLRNVAGGGEIFFCRRSSFHSFNARAPGRAPLSLTPAYRTRPRVTERPWLHVYACFTLPARARVLTRDENKNHADKMGEASASAPLIEHAAPPPPLPPADAAELVALAVQAAAGEAGALSVLERFTRIVS